MRLHFALSTLLQGTFHFFCCATHISKAFSSSWTSATISALLSPRRCISLPLSGPLHHTTISLFLLCTPVPGRFNVQGLQSRKTSVYFAEPVEARHIRFIVQKWNVRAAMRVAAILCGDTLCPSMTLDSHGKHDPRC